MPTTASIAARIAREGQPITLSRAAASVAVQGVVRGYKPEDLVNDIQQGDQEVVISDAEIAAAAWPGPPRRSDAAVINGRTAIVQSCDTRCLRGAVAMHILQVRG